MELCWGRRARPTAPRQLRPRPRRAHAPSRHGKGLGGRDQGAALGDAFASLRRPPARSGRVTLRTVGRSHISLVSRARVGRGGEEGARPLPKWLLPLLGGVRHRGEGREEAAAPPPPRLALLPGADRWKRRSVGRTPARWGRGASARPRWGDGAEEPRCGRSPHPDAGGVCIGRCRGLWAPGASRGR